MTNHHAPSDFIRKMIAFNPEDWKQVERFAAQHFFSSHSQAARLLIARGLAADKPAKTQQPTGKLTLTKHIHLSPTQWDAINQYRFIHRFDSVNLAIRTLVVHGLEIERQQMKQLQALSAITS
tara:strand:+ start:739 stop:1107 length:369 start_codon:yes stop_codon:yes gene_type:complete